MFQAPKNFTLTEFLALVLVTLLLVTIVISRTPKAEVRGESAFEKIEFSPWASHSVAYGPDFPAQGTQAATSDDVPNREDVLSGTNGDGSAIANSPFRIVALPNDPLRGGKSAEAALKKAVDQSPQGHRSWLYRFIVLPWKTTIAYARAELYVEASLNSDLDYGHPSNDEIGPASGT